MIKIDDSKAAADAVSKILKTIGGLSEVQQALTISSLKVFLENASPSTPEQPTQADASE